MADLEARNCKYFEQDECPNIQRQDIITLSIAQFIPKILFLNHAH